MSWLVLVASALALEPGDRVRLELAADQSLEGILQSADGDELVLSSAGVQHTVRLTVVEHAWVDGRSLTPADLGREMAELEQREALERAAQGWIPRPASVAIASVLWPGAGHAMLGQWGLFAGYSGVEAVLLGLSAYYVFYDQNLVPAVPLVAVSALFRGYAAVDSARTASKRRAVSWSAGPTADGWVVGVHIPLGGPARPSSRRGRLTARAPIH